MLNTDQFRPSWLRENEFGHAMTVEIVDIDRELEMLEDTGKKCFRGHLESPSGGVYLQTSIVSLIVSAITYMLF